MSKIVEETFADGSRFVGNGRTGLVFYPDGHVVFRHSLKAVLKALTKNFSTHLPELKGGGGKLYSLGVMDFVDPGDGFAPELAAWAILARNLKDDGRFKLCMKQLVSVVTAARRYRAGRFTAELHEDNEDNEHNILTKRLTVLARKLGRVPYQYELGRALYPDVPYTNKVARSVSKRCAANDLDWLPTGRPGRPKKEKRNKESSL
jgi:hypothetical protein